MKTEKFMRQFLKMVTTHGSARTGNKTPEYCCWVAIKQRCSNPKSSQFDFYGGRGIKVCKRWLKSFPKFLSDMGHKPSEFHSIERRNNSLNYSPDNCYWATKSQQSNNTRKTVFLIMNGVRKPIHQWASEIGISADTLHCRRKNGWSDKEILTTPHGQCRNQAAIYEKVKYVKDQSLIHNVTIRTIHRWLRKAKRLKTVIKHHNHPQTLKSRREVLRGRLGIQI